MKNNTTKSNDRGQVGIGTLIVFIAMVLVAAIAAGVLINTAGLLQTQAEATGEETQQQVSDRLQIQSATGEVTGDEDGVEEVTVSVTKSPGADDIDLEEVTYEFVTDDAVVTGSVGDDLSDADADGGIEFITRETDDEVITDRSDRYTLTFESGDSDSGIGEDDLEPGDNVQLTLTTAAGASTITELRVPDSLVDREAVSL